jgi:acid stress-induced BolA-like protein IbaG/YrbA
MDLKTKVTQALRQALQPERIQVDDENGIYGVVVSNQFSRMSSLDRQRLIDKTLRDPAVKLTKSELRRVFFIMTYTPAEYAAHHDGENGTAD